MENKNIRIIRRSAIGIGVLVLLAAVIVLVIGTLSSEAVNAQTEFSFDCTLQTLKGTYVFEGRGVTLNEDGNVVPYAEAGWQSFDGEGNSEGVFSFSMDGVAIERQSFFESTYELNPDHNCSFTVFAPVGDEVFTFDLYGTDKGTSFSYFAPGVSGRLVKP